jgi:hypothetical protein
MLTERRRELHGGSARSGLPEEADAEAKHVTERRSELHGGSARSGLPEEADAEARHVSPESAAGLVALGSGLLHWWLAPASGTDFAAQVARATFAREAPFTPVDMSWYGGVHPFGYSLLSPWLMALLGVQLAGLLAAVVGSVLWARLVRDAERALLVSCAGAFFLAMNVVSGRTTFALGAAAALGALCALPRRPLAAALAVLTALLSPVAAAFLGLAAAVLVLHRRVGGWTLGFAAAVPVVVLALLFPGGGVQPYSFSSARTAVITAVLVAAVSSSPVVRTGALLYGAAVLLLLVHDNVFGSNILRLGLLLAAPVLLLSARRWVVLLPALAVALVWQAGPPVGDLHDPHAPPMRAMRGELLSLGAQRVEVLAPRDHAESGYVAQKLSLARGWARQQDTVINPLFYEGELTAARYLGWLHERAVDHVAMPRTARLDFGSEREGRLLRAGPVAGLEQVWQDAGWVVYRVTDPVPVVAGVREVSRTRVRLEATAPGPLDVRLRWSRWLSASGPACLERRGDEVRLQVRAAGTVTVTSSLRPKQHC